MTSRNELVPTWLRASELASYFPVFGETTWRKFISSGQLPSRKVGGARIVRTVDVERVLSGEAT